MVFDTRVVFAAGALLAASSLGGRAVCMELTSSQNPSYTGQPVTLTATLEGTTVPPEGTVTFMDGNTRLGRANLVGGVASIQVSFDHTLLTHQIRAVYAGRAPYPSAETSIGQQIAGAPTATSLEIASTGAPSSGQARAIVRVAVLSPAVGRALGAVTLYDETGAVVGSANLGNGSARITFRLTALGAHVLKAVYEPSVPGYLASESDGVIFAVQ